MLSNGIGMSDGRNAFSARRSRQMESLPPEKSRAGRSNSAGDLAHDVDRLGLQVLQVVEMVAVHRTWFEMHDARCQIKAAASPSMPGRRHGLAAPRGVQAALALLVGLGRIEIIPLVRQIVLLRDNLPCPRRSSRKPG